MPHDLCAAVTQAVTANCYNSTGNRNNLWSDRRVILAGIRLGAIVGALSLYFWKNTRKNMATNPIDFEFGETTALKAFWDRNQKFLPAFMRLLALTNKCFGRPWNPKNRMEDIAFNLGETCRQDFLEIVFLAVNGHGIGAERLLRGLYERAVTHEYIRTHPEKAERFVRCAAIQEFKRAVRRSNGKGWNVVREDEGIP